jgi:hypothetical protein
VGSAERRLKSAARALVNVTAANAGDAVYGALMIAVLLAADDARHTGYPATLEAAAVVLVLYWLMTLYAHTLGMRLSSGEPLGSSVWRTCVHELPILEGAVVPVLVLLVAWAAGFGVSNGVTAALLATVVVIIMLELVAGWRSRGRRHLWLEVAAGATMGLLLIAVKFVLY